MKKLYFLLLFLVLLGCSRTVTRLVEVPKIQTEYRNKYLRDSIYLRDSVYLTTKGDTVFVNKFRYKYIDKFIRDTVNRTDTITIVKEVEVPIVTNELTSFQKWSIRGFWYFVILIGIVIFVKLSNLGKLLQ